MVKSIFDIGFWEYHIRKRFIDQVELLYKTIINRFLPTFNSIEKEAEEVSEKEWDELNSSCGTSETDPADLAEQAEAHGINYYMMLSNMKQLLLNISATALYHLFEQQVIFFLRREILHPSQENDISLMSMKVFKKQTNEKGINIESFSSWDKIIELEIVSNSIKHAEGWSANELRKRRPDMFTNPIIRNISDKNLLEGITYPIYMPMAGDDIFVTEDDLSEYKNAIVNFWNEFIETCLNYGDNMA